MTLRLDNRNRLQIDARPPDPKAPIQFLRGDLATEIYDGLVHNDGPTEPFIISNVKIVCSRAS